MDFDMMTSGTAPHGNQTRDGTARPRCGAVPKPPLVRLHHPFPRLIPRTEKARQHGVRAGPAGITRWPSGETPGLALRHFPRLALDPAVA